MHYTQLLLHFEWPHPCILEVPTFDLELFVSKFSLEINSFVLFYFKKWTPCQDRLKQLFERSVSWLLGRQTRCPFFYWHLNRLLLTVYSASLFFQYTWNIFQWTVYNKKQSSNVILCQRKLACLGGRKKNSLKYQYHL